MRQYKIETTEKKFEKGKQLIKSNGGTFLPDGKFNIKGVKGTAKLIGCCTTLHIEIREKPFLIPWVTIDSKLREFFG